MAVVTAFLTTSYFVIWFLRISLVVLDKPFPSSYCACPHTLILGRVATNLSVRSFIAPRYGKSVIRLFFILVLLGALSYLLFLTAYISFRFFIFLAHRRDSFPLVSLPFVGELLLLFLVCVLLFFATLGLFVLKIASTPIPATSPYSLSSPCSIVHLCFLATIYVLILVICINALSANSCSACFIHFYFSLNSSFPGVCSLVGVFWLVFLSSFFVTFLFFQGHQGGSGCFWYCVCPQFFLIVLLFSWFVLFLCLTICGTWLPHRSLMLWL